MDKDKVVEHYNTFKNYAYVYFKRNDIDMAVRLIKLTARIGYNYNFRYCDDDLESLISEIGLQLVSQPVGFESQKDRIVFYDSFGNNRVLAQQYIRSLISMDLEILYIYSSRSLDSGLEKEILLYKKAKILKLDSDSSFIYNVKLALKEIADFKPATIIEHFTPWDILGFCICSLCISSKRYLINLTDHAFWLGKNSSDYILEFRNYGVYLSHYHRHIPLEKLLMQPYYPIQPSVEFSGFPKEVTNNKIILFSGSNLYKISGKDGLFLKIVKRVLDENENVIYLLAGNGNTQPIKKFIKDNNFQGRFILLGHRSDINEVIKNIDIYVNTYPMIGGLMSQYAAVNNKPIIGYTDENLYSYNDTEDLLQTRTKGVLVKTSLIDFHTTLNNLIKNEIDRTDNVNVTHDCVVSQENFTKQLSLNLRYPKHIETVFLDDVKIDLNSVSDLYIEMEVEFLKSHYIYIWEELKWKSFGINFPIGLFSFIYKTRRFLSTKIKFKN